MEPDAGTITPLVRAKVFPHWRICILRLLDAGLLALIALIGLLVVFARVMPMDWRNPSLEFARWATLAGLTRTLALQLGCLLLPLVALAALRRRWRLVLAALPLLAVNLGPALWSYRPRAAPAIAGERVRIMTLNLLRCNQDVDGVVAEIEAENPEVLLLQECSKFWHESLENRLGGRFPYVAYNPRRFDMGLAAFSKRPFIGPVESGGFDDDPPAPPLRLVLDIDGQPVALYNLHLYLPYPPRVVVLRRAQFAGILDRLSQETLPTLLIGDFNETGTGPVAAELTARGFADAHDLGGWGHGGTWPDRPVLRHLPGVRIDHLFLDPRLTCETCHVGKGPGSDHHPVIAEIGFRSDLMTYPTP